MEAFLISTGVVAVAEIGDKTQLLALVLATRHRRPLPIIAGILAATLANHALAGAIGVWLAQVAGSATMQIVVGLAFIAMAVWSLVPDSEPAQRGGRAHYSVFLTTLVAFFLVEIGDKTQVATVALAAHFDALAAVIVGTTFGMLIANVPVVLAADVIRKRLPMTMIRAACALMFLALGAYALLVP